MIYDIFQWKCCNLKEYFYLHKICRYPVDIRSRFNYLIFQPPGQPGGSGLGMMNKQLPLAQMPVQPGLGQQMLSSWPRWDPLIASPPLPSPHICCARYAGPGHLLSGIASAFPPRYNGGGGGGGGSPPSQSGGMAAKQGESLSRTNLYIRGLSPHTTDKDLINLCQK